MHYGHCTIIAHRMKSFNMQVVNKETIQFVSSIFLMTLILVVYQIGTTKSINAQIWRLL